MKKNDWILIGIVLGIISVSFFLNLSFGKKERGNVVVSVKGHTFGTYSLEKNQEIQIGNTNLIKIQDGQVYMEQADCPDQTCVAHKPIYSNREVIICLPNKVSVEIHSREESKVDSISK